MTRDQLLSDLYQALRLLTNVYYFAQDNNDGNVERLMSAADSCIIEAIEALDREPAL